MKNPQKGHNDYVRGCYSIKFRLIRLHKAGRKYLQKHRQIERETERELGSESKINAFSSHPAVIIRRARGVWEIEWKRETRGRAVSLMHH